MQVELTFQLFNSADLLDQVDELLDNFGVFLVQFGQLGDRFFVRLRCRRALRGATWALVERISAGADRSSRCCRQRLFSGRRRRRRRLLITMNIPRIVARVGGLVEVEPRWTGELVSDDAKTGSLQAPEVFLAVAWMRIEAFVFALEVASGILIQIDGIN